VKLGEIKYLTPLLISSRTIFSWDFARLAPLSPRGRKGAVRANVQTLVALFTLCFFMVQTIRSESTSELRIEEGCGMDQFI